MRWLVLRAAPVFNGGRRARCDAPDPTMTPHARLQLFFLSQFLSVGMINAYSGIWFAQRGLSAFEIGVIGAAPVAALLAITLTVGRIADLARDWKHVIVAGAWAAGLLPFGLYLAQGFWSVLLCWTLLAVAQRVIVPVADAAAIRMARRQGFEFGALRGLGTLGYLTVVVVAGYAMGDGGVALFLPLFVALGLLRAVAALGLPPLRAPEDRLRDRSGVPPFRSVLTPALVLPMAGWAAVNASHVVLNAFQGLLWAEQGIQTEIIGLLIALGALAETVMFFRFRRVAQRFAPLTLLLIAAGTAVLRWVAMAFEPGVALLVPLQVLHAVSYAMGFLACTNFIADSTGEDHAAQAQSFQVVMELAITIVILLVFGWLAGDLGAQAYLASAVLAAGGGLCIWVARRAPAARPI